MSIRDYPAYIFDLDGTIFTIPVDWTKVRDDLGKIAGAPVGEGPIFLKVEQLLAVRPSLRETVFGMIDRHEHEALGGALPMDGAIELLSHLSKDAKLGLVTMQGTAACDKVLGKHRLAELFDVTMTREDSLDRTIQLRGALHSLGVPPKETLFTGDRMNDVICGKRAGVGTALVGKEPSAEAKPDYVFPTLAMLKAALISETNE